MYDKFRIRKVKERCLDHGKMGVVPDGIRDFI